MGIIIDFIKADCGDSFLIRFIKGKKITTLLIDGGFKSKYAIVLKGLLKTRYSDENSENYILITHVDSDHIGGIQGFFEDPQSLKQRIKEVFFNSGTKLKKLLPDISGEPEDIRIADVNNLNTSIEQGKKLESYLIGLGLYSDRDLLISGKAFDINGIKCTVLSPRIDTLNRYTRWYEKEDLNLNTSTKATDYNLSINELINKEFEEDTSITNASSISTLIEFEDKRMLFLGDSIPSDIIKSLNELMYDSKNKLYLDLVKVSHHGSRMNTSDDLLDIINSKKFLISTNGSKYGHPDKESLARIIAKQNKPELIFNYDISKKIFFDEEINSNLFKIRVLNEVII